MWSAQGRALANLGKDIGNPPRVRWNQPQRENSPHNPSLPKTNVACGAPVELVRQIELDFSAALISNFVIGVRYMGNKDLIGGLVRLHILHHAVKETIFGLGIMEELSRHGYGISPGTLYPILHSLEKQGLLKSKSEFVDGKKRRIYRATSKGRAALEDAKVKVKELFGELFEG